jgi:hypothetical protein
MGVDLSRTCIRKTQALDGMVTAINGRITAPYGSMSIILIWVIMYVHVWSPNLIIGLAPITLNILDGSSSKMQALFD